MLTDPLQYEPEMQILPPGIMEEVLARRAAYRPEQYTAGAVELALSHRRRTPEDFAALLSPAASGYLEEMARQALQETQRHFGNAVYVFTPLYIANYCENYCVYCGFNCHNPIRRARLNGDELDAEMEAIRQEGIEEILILTGESRQMSDVHYIGEAIKKARRYFKMIGLEIYPVNVADYAYLHACGADYVTVFQETYDLSRYQALHLAGHKRVFPYRICAQERALQGGMRGVGLAVLLGLADFRRDAFATGMHGWLLQRKYPQAEISFSCPRLRPILHNDKINPQDVHEPQLLQILLAYRLFMPFAGITISTRERAAFRDRVIGMAATKISAGSKTGIGEHSAKLQHGGDDQFEIADIRGFTEICAAIRRRGLQPVTNDYVFV